jgi:four helix bundle protein
MTYARFEEIPAWQEAIRLAEGVYDMTESNNWPGSRSLQDQLERAALSVSNNIAEGFERGTTNELLAFLYIARGSAGEVRSMLCFLERRPAFSNFKFRLKFEIIGRELFAPIARLGGLPAELGDQRPAAFN